MHVFKSLEIIHQVISTLCCSKLSGQHNISTLGLYTVHILGLRAFNPLTKN